MISESLIKAEPIVGVLLGYFLSAIACIYFILTGGKRTRKSLGMQTSNLSRDMLSGWIIAALCLSAVFLINIFSGGITSQVRSDFAVIPFLLLLIGFIFQGYMEEFLVRGLLMTQITLKTGPFWAIIINSAIFSAGHFFNDSSSVISSINTFLIAIIFSLIFYYYDNLWIVAGFHAGWNFILGPILGINVSGFNMPTTLIKSTFNPGMEYLNGGAYGFEASYLVTAICFILIAVYVFLIMRRNSEEKILSSQKI